MTTTAQPPSDKQGQDDAELAEFGYKPELRRTLGNFHTFAHAASATSPS